MTMRHHDSDIRTFLIAETFLFIRRAIQIPGVTRIALIGSLITGKANPKDADILVTVDDEADLAPLATAARKLKGAAQGRNKGADVFLANPAGHYIGRICQWRECRPGIRIACDARHCGNRHYLHDDLASVNLDSQLIAKPPLEVWPATICRVSVADDLLSRLSFFQASTSK